MNFCPQCESVLNLFINEENNLTEKCKNCGYIVEVDLNNSNPVYSNNISNDVLNSTYEMLDNKYIIKDPTLPRLNNLKCINKECLTNNEHQFIVVKHIDNLDVKKFTESLKNVIGKAGDDITIKLFENDNIKEKNMYSFGELHSKNIFFDKKDLENNSIHLLNITGLSINKYSELFEQPHLENNTHFSDCIKYNNQPNPRIYLIDKQIVFIKYDSKNMKYMYICSTCSTTWKNI